MRGLQFNPLTGSLLASGAGDGELCIWDCAAPGAPTQYPTLRGASAAGAGSSAGEVRARGGSRARGAAAAAAGGVR